jgi:hypothetical protein
VVGSHVVENVKEIRLFNDLTIDSCSFVDPIFYGFLEATLMGRNQRLKIHEVFSQGAGLVEAAEVDDPTHDHSVLFNAENAFLLEFFNGIDDTEGHGDRKGRRDGDGDEVQKLDDEVKGCDDFLELGDHADVGDDGDREEDQQEFG